MIARFPSLVLTLTATVSAGQFYTAPFGEGGTWNLYQAINRFTTWDEAKGLAESMKPPLGNPGARGHLVTLSSIAENHFIRLVADRQSVWCGLTDDERFGGHEAGSHPRDGWKWITGEPVTFSNWKPVEPDNWTGGGPGEDAVFIERYGKWCDTGSGFGGQSPTNYSFVVEWETRSAKPVEGAIPLEKTWPDGVVMPPLIPGKWNARWKYTSAVSIPKGALMLDNKGGADPFAEPTAAGRPTDDTATGQFPWLWLATPDSNRQGWLGGTGQELKNFPGLPPRSPYIGAVVGKIHVEKAGTYTFAVTAEDAFALRIGGLKWKSASGDGAIDPLDPFTFTQPYGTFSTKALAVMDLPAGDHLVEALWMVETTGSEFHVLSAPGTHLIEGSTADWRPLGHPKSDSPVPTLGITAAGWTVDRSLPGQKDPASMGLQDGLIKLELDLDRTTQAGLASINFSDAPATNASHFPDAKLFPTQAAAPQTGEWPLRARARLVVPESGAYQIGLQASGLASMRLKGGVLRRVPQTAQGSKGLHLREDTFDFNGQADSNSEPKIVTEWDLSKGEHDIEILYVKKGGPSLLAVFSSPTGPYPPALLTIGGAKLTDDVPGLPHASR